MDFSYGNLGFWRKLFIWCNWFFTFLFVGALIFKIGYSDGAPDPDPTVVIGFSVLLISLVAYCYWVQVAISRRRLSQLALLTLLQLVPFLSPIHAVMFFAIWWFSKKEINVNEQAA